jgi:catechol 2,3-dioxygenase-like lactoylglutathione lyase family enzyme
MDKLNFDCKHLTYRVADTTKSKIFYIDNLGLTLLDEKPNFLALKVGNIRISFFGGHKPSSQTSDEFVGTNIVLSTQNIEQTRDKLVEKGVVLKQDIVIANNFLKFIVLLDPDNLIVEIAEYLIKDTLESKL